MSGLTIDNTFAAALAIAEECGEQKRTQGHDRGDGQTIDRLDFSAPLASRMIYNLVDDHQRIKKTVVVERFFNYSFGKSLIDSLHRRMILQFHEL